MILFKSCPKCGTGDLVKTTDMYGAYVECVQCGFSRDVAHKRSVRQDVHLPTSELATGVLERRTA